MSPRLSVVVPVRNAESVLPDCLRSLAAQSMTDLEVVLVDDGSTDGGARLAEKFAAADSRFRLVEQPQTGPGGAGRGAARNTGLLHTDPASRYLAFLDGEDVLPPDAYRLLVETLEETGSDFATGNVLRLRPGGPVPAGNLRKAMAQTRPATHLTRHLDLVQDRAAWNKVFRRDFWERHAFVWPEGSLSEDIPVILPAHLLAASVDVLGEYVHHRRPREGSLTRRRTDPAQLRDRIEALSRVRHLLADPRALARRSGHREAGHSCWEAAARHWDTVVLTGDMAQFLKVLHRGGEELPRLFTELAAEYASHVHPAVLDGLPAAARLKWHLIRERRTEDLLDALAFERENPNVLPVSARIPRRAALLRPDGEEIRVPRRVARVAPAELPLHTRLREAEWQPDGTLRLRGYAYIRSVGAERPARSRKTAWLRQRGSRRRVPLRVRTVPAPEATRNSRQRLYCYDASGFEITLDPDRLLRHLGTDRRTGSWTFGIAVLTGGLLRRGGIAPGGQGSGAHPLVRELADGRRLVLGFPEGKLRLTVAEVHARLLSHRLDGDEAELCGVLLGDQQATALRTAHGRSGTSIDHPLRTGPPGPEGRTSFTARVPLAELAGAARSGDRPHGTEQWRTSVVLADGTTRRVVLSYDSPPGRYPMGTDTRPGAAGAGGGAGGGAGAVRELCLCPDAGGNLLLVDRTAQPVVDRIGWEADGELRIEGSCTGAGGAGGAGGADGAGGAPELVWRHSSDGEEITVPLRYPAPGRFTAVLRPAVAAPGGLPLPPGRWDPYFRTRPSGPPDAPVRLAPDLLAALPSHAGPERAFGGRTFTLERRLQDRLFVHSGSDRAESERGVYRQHLLRTRHYPRASGLPLRDAVLYNSFHGRQFSDSPRALHEELVRRGTGVEHLWAVSDGRAAVPPTARAVVQGSAEWYEALARSRWLVGNTHFPRCFERRAGQVAVQTWHGTPLKRIGHDLAGTEFANPDYLAGLTRRAAQWSLLLSPNSFSTPILRRAFGYRGEILESGYPRNDLLYAPDREARAESVRRRLGLPRGRRVVLYAPTWRDDGRHAAADGGFGLQLDLPVARAALGADHVLLVRRHYRVTEAVPGTGDGFVLDVSAYPDTAELLLIADVLITDYSSMMFDFAHTGRPMLFFTYDLERYRDVLRGFYFDFETRAPGPLLAGSDEVIAALRETDGVAAGYRSRYAEFRSAFCDLDDGGAASRVAERMLECAAP